MSSNFSGTVTADALTATTGPLVVGAASVTEAEITMLDGITAGTAAASKAVVLDGSKGISTITSATITTLTSTTVNATGVVLGAGGYIDLDSETKTLSSNAVTLSKRAVQVTSESLTTAAGASQAMTLTLTGVAATDIVLVTAAGGTNTRKNIAYEAVCTSNTVTVTVYNNEPTNALNGTLIYNVLIMKA